jgi:hypothetical protein
MSEKRLNEERSAIEAALCALKPSASSTDRDRVIFLAGRASVATSIPSRPVRKTHWIWPCITAISLLLAVGSSSMYFLQGKLAGDRPAAFVKGGMPSPRKIVQTPPRDNAQSSTPKENRPGRGLSTGRKDASTSFLALSMLVADKGVEALPGPLWVPMGSEMPPRRDPTIQDDWKDF